MGGQESERVARARGQECERARGPKGASPCTLLYVRPHVLRAQRANWGNFHCLIFRSSEYSNLKIQIY